MAKRKSTSKNKIKDNRKDAKKRDDGSAEIKRAEKRLTAALSGVDDARDKVARRERDLAALMERYGRTPASDTPAEVAIPLEAGSQITSENGTDHVDAASPSQEPVEQPAAGGAEHHG